MNCQYIINCLVFGIFTTIILSCVEDVKELPFLRTDSFELSPLEYNSLVMSATIQGLEMGVVSDLGFVLADDANQLFIDNSEAIVCHSGLFAFEKNRSTFRDTLSGIKVPPNRKKLRSFLIYEGKTIYGNTLDVVFGDGWQLVSDNFYPISEAVSANFEDDLLFGLGCGISCMPGIREYGLWRFNIRTKDQKTLQPFSGAFRRSAVSVNLDGALFYGGGVYNQTYFDDFWIFYPNQDVGVWNPISNFIGTPRSRTISFKVSDEIYVGFGRDDSNAYDDMYAYHLSNKTWSKVNEHCLGERPGKIEEALGFSIGEKGYLLMGLSGNKKLRDIWEFDPSITDCHWKFIGVLPGGMPWRKGSSIFVLNNKAYITAGVDLDNNFYKDVWEFNPESTSPTLTRKKDLVGDRRTGAIGFTLDGLGYIAAGVSYGLNGSRTLLTDIWQYNPEE